MVGIIALVTLISVPSLFVKRCPKCGRRNFLDVRACKYCGAVFQENEP